MTNSDNRKLSEHSLAEYTSVLWFFMALFILNLIRVYANRTMFRWHTYILVFIAYFCAFGLIILIPIDAALTIKGRTDDGYDNYHEYRDKVRSMYVSLYWPSFVLGSVVLVWWEHFNQDGHFSVPAKLLSAGQRQLKIWSMMGVAGIIFFSILLGSGAVGSSIDALQVTCIAMNNTLGMVVLVVLLGYGLVQFPRQMWTEADLDKQLLKTQQRAAAAFKKLSEASLQVSMTVANVMRTNQEVQKMTNPDIRTGMEVVLADCPKEFSSGTVGKVQTDKHGQITIHTLAELRRTLNIEKANYKMEQARVDRIKRQAYFLEDIIASRNREDRVQKIRWSFGVPESTRVEWVWYTRYRPMCQRALAVVLAGLSSLVLFGVIGMMAGRSSGLSVFSLVVHRENASSAGITIFILLTLAYLAHIVAWGMFQLRVGNIMQIVPDRQTTPKSMSCNSRQCCRLAPPIAFFYLGLLYENNIAPGNWMEDEDGKRLSTAFSNFYGSMKVVPFLGNSFNTFFPVVIIVVAGITLLNVLNKIFVWCKLPQFQFGDVEVTDDQLREGRRQLARQRKQMERTVARQQTKQAIDKARNFQVFSTIHNQLLKLTGNEPVGEDDTNAPQARVMTEEDFMASAPAEKSGWLDRKAGRKMGVAGGWQSRFFNVKMPGVLSFYKSDDVSSPPQGSIDLRLVLSVRNPLRKGQVDMARLELELPDRNLIVRAKNAEEARAWQDSILAWKDFILDRGVYFPSRGVFDQEGGPKDVIDEDDDDDDNGNDDGEVKYDDLEAGNKHKNDVRPPSAANPSGSYTPPKHTRDGSFEFGAKPDFLEGLLEKKSPTNKFNPWQQRYFRINEQTNCLEYFKSQADLSLPAGSFDLTMITDVCEYTKGDKPDPRRFTIDTGDREYKMRAPDAASAAHWIKQLNLWRDYALLAYAREA